MNRHKQFHFTAVLLLVFALSLALVPVCHAQLDGSSGSDELESGETDTDTGSRDTGSGQADTGSSEADTASPGKKGLVVFQAARPNPVPPDTEQSIQSTVDAFRAALGDNNLNMAGPLPLVGRREINWDGGANNDTTDQPATPLNVFLNTRGAQFITAGARPCPGASCGRAPARVALQSFSTTQATASSSAPSAPYGYSLRWAVTLLKLCFSSPARTEVLKHW